MEDAITLSLKKTEIELEKIGIDLLKKVFQFQN